MKSNNKRASIFVYVLILINIALIIGYVVYNNTYILNNNISIGRNAEEVFSVLNDKGNINIETVRQYNGNGGGFSDFISCPTNITMSGSTVKQEGLSSEMYYDYGTVYCYFEYNGEGVRLFFDPETQDYTRAYYDGELRDVENGVFYNETTVSNSDLSIDYSNTTDGNNGTQSPDRIFDPNLNKQYLSKRSSDPSIALDFNTPKIISKVTLNKKVNNSWNYWNEGTMRLILEDGSEISTTISGARYKTVIEKDFAYSYFSSGLGVTKLIIEASGWNKFLNISSISISEWGGTGEERWYIETEFNDPDNTYMFFDSTGVGGDDNIDDNMNSDNYRATSTGSITYPGDFLDDDITPRTTIFSSLLPNTSEYYNVFWNNSKTNDFIDSNPYNDDTPTRTVKIGDVEEGNLKFDIFTLDGSLDYDMKIIEFDKTAYEQRNTLLPINVYETTDINQNYGYLQLNGDTLSLSPYKTGNEFEFDFKNRDYSIYFTNGSDENMAMRMIGEEVPASGDINDKGRTIYINPINDSYPNTIETMVNHILAGGEKNYIGENFIMVGNK